MVSAGLMLLLAGIAVGYGYERRAEQGLRRGLQFQAGHAYRYEFSWTSSERTSLVGAITGVVPDDSADEVGEDFELRGTLLLKSYESSGTRQLVGAQFESLSGCRLEIMDVSLTDGLRDALRTLCGREALLHFDGMGRLEGIEFPDDAPEIFTHTLASVLAESTLDIQLERSHWRTNEISARGESVVDWRARGGFWPTLTKTRARYVTVAAVLLDMDQVTQSVQSRTDVSLSTSGHIERLHARETLLVRSPEGGVILSFFADTHLELESVFEFTGQPPDLRGAPVDPLEVAALMVR
jgi:hypothetical protein